MPNPYRHVFDQSSRQQSERTKTGANVRLGDVEIAELEDKREELAKAKALEKRDKMSKLKELIRNHPGIKNDEILKFGGYKEFPEKEMKLLKNVKAIEWRKNGYFVREA